MSEDEHISDEETALADAMDEVCISLLFPPTHFDPPAHDTCIQLLHRVKRRLSRQATLKLTLSPRVG